MDAGLEFVHLAALYRPHSPASAQVAKVLANDGGVIAAGATPVLDEVRCVVELSQTCNVVRSCRGRPFVEVAPLVEVAEEWLEEIRRLKRLLVASVPPRPLGNLHVDYRRSNIAPFPGTSLLGNRNRSRHCLGHESRGSPRLAASTAVA